MLQVAGLRNLEFPSMKVQLFGLAFNSPRFRSKKLFIFNTVALTILFSLPACAAGGGWRKVSATPSTVSFGNQTVGTVSSPQTITVKNTGGRSVTVQSMTVNNSAFVLSGWQGATTLAPSSSLIVGVAFRPSAQGSVSGTVSISAGGGSNTSISLSGTGVASQTTPPPPSVSISVSPTQAALQVGKAQQFTSSVSGSTNTSVTWSVNGVTGGNSTVGTISTTGLYAAPGAVPSGSSVNVKATSAADPTKSASAAVSIVAAPTAVSVSVSPTSATVTGGNSQQFSATVSGTSNTSVMWAVNGIQGGNSTLGSISSTGMYSAPSCPSQSSVTVTATSSYDSSASANASVAISGSASAGTGGNYYVATNGSDSNDGSACRPWRTIQHAANVVNPGSTVN